MSTSSEADRIAAEGITIPTTQGDLRLLYGMRALRAMEAHYGSVVGMQTQMQAVLDRMTQGDGDVAAFGPLADIVGFGLLHLGYTQDQVDDLLLPRHTRLYAEAMSAAMREAFPDDDNPLDPAVAGQGNAPGQPAPAGPGASGTTSPPADTAAPMASSGA